MFNLLEVVVFKVQSNEKVLERYNVMSLKLATEFATSLDNCQFDNASKVRAEHCKYHYSEGNYEGRENIISLYRQNDLLSKKVVDEIIYSSNVEDIGKGDYKINFVDKIRKGHRWHEHRFYEIVTLADNLIINIEHCDIPGEKESLRMFFSRPSSTSALSNLQ